MENKVFEILIDGERELVSGKTVIEALKTYLYVTDIYLFEMDDNTEVIEIPKEKWPEINLINTEYNPNDPDDKENFTLEEYMRENTSSELIGGSAYT